MNEFISNLKGTICSYDQKNERIYFNGTADNNKLINVKIKSYLDSMLSEKQKMVICKIEDIEILILYLGSCEQKETFYLDKTMELEESIFNMESIKALELEVDTILDTIHDDVLITDGTGIITRVYPSFEKVYNIKKKDVEGKSVYDLEKQGIFKPSITAKVLEKGEQVTMMQETIEGKKLIVTATPIKNQKGETIKIISFTRDLTDFIKLKEQYSLLENKVEKYSAEIEKLRGKNMDSPKIIGRGKKFKSIIKTIDKVSRFDANILIEGESGVGKTMFARMIHKKSNRSKGPLIEIDCGAIPENLLESELFGYEKGSFTGASEKGKMGLIELADKGTLFLDEIGELPLNLQMKLLKVIQEKKITHIGGTKEISVDFRLITATNKNLKRLIHQGVFRGDLYYRLNVIYIDIPSLRERNEDIIHLSMYFLDKYNKKYGFNKSLSSEIFDCFMKYEWPGNIRELENIIERIVLISDKDVIETNLLPPMKQNDIKFDTLQQSMEEYEKQLVIEAYNKWRSTIGVAKELGISQPTAVRKIKKYTSS